MPCFWVAYLGESLGASIFSIKRCQIHTVACGPVSVCIQEELSPAPAGTWASWQLWSTVLCAPTTSPNGPKQAVLVKDHFVSQNRNPLKVAQDKSGAFKSIQSVMGRREDGLSFFFLLTSHFSSFLFSSHPSVPPLPSHLAQAQNGCSGSNEMWSKDTWSYSSGICYLLELLFVSLGSKGISLVQASPLGFIFQSAKLDLRGG